MTIKTAPAVKSPIPEVDLPPLSPDRPGWPLDGSLADYLDEVLPDEVRFADASRKLAEDLGSFDL